MKKFLLFVATFALGILMFPSLAFSSCQDVRFSDGNYFCFDIKRINSSTFESQISSKSVSTSLSCELTLPNGRSITFSNCEGRFAYDGNDVGKIALKATARTTYYFVANYDFRNGSFSNYGSSSSSSLSSSYSDYYPEFTSVSDSEPGLDKWLDITLKIKRSGSSYHYNGNVDFYVERYNGNSRSRASTYQYDLSKSTYYFSSSDGGEVKLYNFIRFRENGEYRLVAELRGNNSVTHQTFYVDNYNGSSSSSSYNAKELSVYSVSSSSPSTNQWINVTLRAIASNGSIASNYNKKVRIEVQKYYNGLWRSASSSDYELDRTTYTFTTSDNGSKTFNSLVKFKYSGEYRLKFSEYNDSSVYGTRTINVGSSSSSSSSSSYNAKELSVYSVSSSSPSTYQWIDVTLRAITNNGSIASNYNRKIKIEVQEYRNGSWRSASSSDYELDRTTYTFSTSDNGKKTFYSLVRFKSTGEFRLKFTENNDSSVYGTRTINVRSSSSYYYNDYYYNNYSDYSNDNFTDSEMKKIRAVYDIWDDVISSLERDYPRLKNSSSWKRKSNTFYNDMKDVLKDSRSASFRSWSDFYNGFIDWLNYTTTTR